MRQAGRYLPEYRAIRKRHSMLEVIRSPQLAAEVTLQPLRRFDLDAAIIFADILNPLIGMGLDLDFVQGAGPKIFNPIESADDVAGLTIPTPDTNVGYTLEAIELVCSSLSKRSIPLIGFCGAPFTLACYACGGLKSNDFAPARSLLQKEPTTWNVLQEKLTELMSEYLIAQVDAGVSAVQVFDTWAGLLSREEYEVAALPHLQSLIKRVRTAVDVPLLYFATNALHLAPAIATLKADGYGLDWRMNFATARELYGRRAVLQGNLNPNLLVGEWGPVEEAAQQIIATARSYGPHIFNVGHGLLPETKIENLARLVELVRGE